MTTVELRVKIIELKLAISTAKVVNGIEFGPGAEAIAREHEGNIMVAERLLARLTKNLVEMKGRGYQ